MTSELRFWRDVEIFNIPDAPTANKPGRSGTSPLSEQAEAESPADSPEGAIDLSGRAGLDGAAAARCSVIQRFPVPMAGAQRTTPLLPWHDPRFHIPDQPDVPGAAVRKSPPGDVGPRLPASYAHAIYLGVGAKERFVKFILRTHGIAPTDDELYRPATGRGWLAAFIANAAGVPLARTYVAASFAAGSCLLQQHRSLDDAGAELRSRSAAFDERMDERRMELAHADPTGVPALSWDDLLKEWEAVHRPLGGTAPFDEEGPLGPSIVIESVPLYRRDDGTLNPAPEQAATFLNSFYIDDLTALIQGGPETFSSALGKYLGPDSATESRQDLLADPAALARHAAAALIPPGRWVTPPNEHLALAQQAAVYQILAQIGRPAGECSRGLMAVNGPPGTGKTTLLKDIIADVVVQRATRLCDLEEPDALFLKKCIAVSAGGSGTEALTLRPDLVAGTEIVVTSSNNAAVQNISFELPFSCDRATFAHAGYFPEVAAFIGEKFRLPRKDPWGLLSAALGAKANRDKIATALMGYEKAVKADEPDTHPVPGKPASLKPWLDQARHQLKTSGGGAANRRWHAAKADFGQRLAAVGSMRARLESMNAALDELPTIGARRHALQLELDEQRRSLATLETAYAAREAARQADGARAQTSLIGLHHQITALQSEHDLVLDRLREIKELHNPGWLAHSLKKILGIETQAYQHWKTEVTQARAAADHVRSALLADTEERDRLNAHNAQRTRQAAQDALHHAAAVQAQNERAAVAGDALTRLAEREAALQARLVPMDPDDAACLPDGAFLALEPAERHRRSVWVTARLELARAELFLSALRLHEATMMATAGDWFKVLRVVRDFLGGHVEPRTREDRAALWHAIFFVIPVVSTTLASFGRLFEGMERESLGWVLVDEAGQATPASVAGALWRAQRAVLVGDPLQIEPVVTVPRKLVESLGRNRGLDDPAVTRWSPSVQSAQTIADRTMRLGAMVGDVWTGLPLRTHRRCMSPMFAIANQIAYQNQMVQATKPRNIDPDLFPSSWIDLRGEATGKVVSAQVEAIRQIMTSFLAAWPQVMDDKGEPEPASVYIISPFRDVALACKEVAGAESPLGRKFAKKKLRVDAGTVHTFQGKEASIVFLVLGSAMGVAGARSRNWAASKPNLLNVAVTRAQQRFYVIGNYADWASLPFFCELAEPAKRMPRSLLEPIEGTALVRLVAATSDMPTAQ